MTVERSADASAPATSAVIDPPADAARAPYLACAVVGLGGLFSGVTGPLLSTFVPPLVRDALGDHRTAIGLVMAIDNVLLLLLVPWSGAASDRASASGRGRLPIVIGGFVLAAAGMALFPASASLGIAGLIGAIVVLYTGINVQRSPFQALVADLVPSRYRSLATGSVTFQMCVGAIVFLMLGRMLGHAARVPGCGRHRAGDRRRLCGLACGNRRRRSRRPPRPRFGRCCDVAWSAARGLMPGIRAIFVASLLLQLTFQTFTTWFALHGTERFGVRPEDVTIGFIAWAIGGVIGALPAGMIGVRIGRRNAMLLGFALMTACLVALDRVTAVSQAIAAAGARLGELDAADRERLSALRRADSARSGVASSRRLFLLCMALGGGIGDPLNGAFFDLVGSYRPLFLLMAAYTVLAFVAVLFVPRGAGEADTGPDSAVASALAD